MDHRVESSLPGRSQTPRPDKKDLLTREDVERLGALWQPVEWPAATDASCKAGYRRAFRYHVERVRHLGLSGGVLIDAGCGSGRWSFAWATRFERVVGFDVAPHRIAVATWQKQRLGVPSVEFVTGNLRKIPADDASADVIYCNNVIFGTYPIEPVLEEFFRVLKPGGVCYLGLNGAGLSYERVSGGDPRLADLGRRRIYNTLCQRHLSPLVATIAPGGPHNAEAGMLLRSGLTPTDLLTRLNCRRDQVIAAETIAHDLGPAFSRQLLDDLAAIDAGAKAGFGDREAGRDLDADEMSTAAQAAGFGRSEWAPDGWLSLRPDGSVQKTPCAAARPGAHEFEGRIRAYEMLLWKPSAKAGRASAALDAALVEPGVAADIRRTSETKWRLQSGNTTFWNARTKEIIPTIIDPTRPMVTELERAIITPREIEAKIDGPREGRLRHARGAIYDRDRNLLPFFVEREAFEASLNKGNRLKNEPTLSKQELVDAKKIKGKYVYLGILRAHFGHFLLESLCRVWYLLKWQPKIKVIMHSDGDTANLPSYIHYIFSLLDLTLDRLILVTQPLIVEHLLVPDSEFDIRWKARTSYADTFRQLYERSSRLHPVASTPNRVYLTRRQLEIRNPRDRRKVVNNEADVESLFSRRGFTIVAPEKLPLHEQIALVGGAGQIAGLKGSALHMSLFSQRPKAKLIQIGRKQSMNQSLIDGAKCMEGHQIFCESPETETGCVVDLEIIRAAVREM